MFETPCLILLALITCYVFIQAFSHLSPCLFLLIFSFISKISFFFPNHVTFRVLEKVEVNSVRVACTVTSRFARTVVTSKALNAANASQEIGFEMDLPKTAFITSFSMSMDGHVYAGEVKEKEKAKKQYEKAVSKGQSAGLVKVSGRTMEQFSMSVNVAAKSSVTFVLIYEELLQRTLGQYEIVTRVKVEQPVQEFQITADIYEPQGIAFVEATATFLTNELLNLVEKTTTDTKAHISFSPTAEQQRCAQCPQGLINGDFIIKYDVKREKGFGEIQVVNGYFVHFFSPPDLARVPKNVVFVIDRSISMEGKKMAQTRDAMVSILKDLHEDDHFGIIQFDDSISNWKEHLTRATEENISAASHFVRSIKARGATDINAAVLSAVNMLKRKRQNDNVPERSVDMIILLTDGNPSFGETSAEKIQEKVRLANAGAMSLFSLGFGNDVDYSLLDVLSRENKGIARRIFEGSDAVVQLKGFYEEVSNVLLSEVDLRYPDNAVSALTKNRYSQLFSGSEIVVAGRLNENDVENILVEVSGQGVRNGHEAIKKKKHITGRGVHVRLQWSDTTSVKDDSLDIRLTNSCSLTVSLRHTVKFRIIRHTKIWKKYHDQQDYLGFYTLDSHHLSSSVHGLLGQFYHGVEFEVTDSHPGEVEGNSNAIMYIKGQTINVTRHWEKDFSRDVKAGKNVLCWFANDDGHGLIDGSASDYTVPHLFTF
uniref:Inter-alpha-trypsin inhibitor heavy chain H3 n=1 Tax=Poecilia latipinna TaxID=48699 RepID=A0A3B3V375_9TELE